MNKNNDKAIQSIKDTLKKLMKFTTEMKYEDVPLQDGTMLCIEDGSDIEVGTPIYQKDKDGNPIPADDNTYVLSDGRSVVIKNGMIESIADADPTQADAEAASPEADANVQSAKVKMDDATQAAPTGATNTEDGNSLETRVANLEGQISEILEVLQSMSNMQEQTMSAVHDFGRTPAEESYKSVKTGSNDVSKRNKFSADMAELKEIQKKYKLNSGNHTNHSSFNKTKGAIK